ncbi:MAG: DUF1638 domain-containing protein [Desulfobacterales bacterium]|nr:MAG: DUF1638 domain-containing protein [Desulfobacterales bacterium]
MATLGIITCEILELEFAHLLANDTDVSRITVVDTGFGHGFIRAVEQQKGYKPRLVDYIGKYLPAQPERFEVLVQVMELGLHTVIKNLRAGVTNAALEMGPHVNAIMIGYGLCGNALQNHEEILKEADVPIFMPIDEDHPVDDCVGLIIGGRTNYYQEQCNVAGTFFMNAGFSRHWKDLLHKAHGVKFDEAISKRIMAGYERSLLLTTPVLSEEEMAANIEEFNQIYELRTEVRAGTLEILEKTWAKGKQFVISNTPSG